MGVGLSNHSAKWPSALVDAIFFLPSDSKEKKERKKEREEKSYPFLVLSSFSTLRLFSPNSDLSADGTPDMPVHSRTTHVHVCVIPGIDRLLLDRSEAGSMLFLPFARATLPFIFCSLRLRRYWIEPIHLLLILLLLLLLFTFYFPWLCIPVIAF